MESVLVFCAAFAFTAFCAAPATTFGDAGELAAAAATLGLPHAPSYPTHVLAARAFADVLHWGNWGYRTNLFSAFCGALALVLLADAARRSGASLAGRCLAVLALLISPLWARELGVTEVFGLHVLACSAVLWVCAAHRGALCAPRPAGALGLIFGLGFAGHQTLALFAPAVLWSAVREKPTAPRAARAVVAFVALFLVGAGFYAYLPVRSAVNPPLNWGKPTTPERFFHVVLRRDYGSLALTVDGAAGGVTPQAGRFARILYSAAPVAAGLGLAGLALQPSAAAALAFAAAGPGFLMLGRPPLDPQTSGALDRFALAPLAALVLPASAALTRSPWLGAAMLASRPQSSRWDLASYDYGRALLKSLPPGAALFMDGGDDTFYALAFLQQALGRRRDVELHDRGGLVFPNPYGADFRGLSRENKENRRLGVERAYAQEGRLHYTTLADSLDPKLPLEPRGLVRRPVTREPAPPDLEVERWSEASLSRYRDRALVAVYPYMRATALRRAGKREEALAEYLRTAHVGGDALWTRANAAYGSAVIGYDAAQTHDWALAERAYLQALSLKPSDADALKNLSVVRARMNGARR